MKSKPKSKKQLQKEYIEISLEMFRDELNKVNEQYKDDPQGLKLFKMGIKESIESLEKDLKELSSD